MSSIRRKIAKKEDCILWMRRVNMAPLHLPYHHHCLDIRRGRGNPKYMQVMQSAVNVKHMEKLSRRHYQGTLAEANLTSLQLEEPPPTPGDLLLLPHLLPRSEATVSQDWASRDRGPVHSVTSLMLPIMTVTVGSMTGQGHWGPQNHPPDHSELVLPTDRERHPDHLIENLFLQTGTSQYHQIDLSLLKHGRRQRRMSVDPCPVTEWAREAPSPPQTGDTPATTASLPTSHRPCPAAATATIIWPGPQATANIPVDRKILHLMNPMKKIMVATMDMVVRVAVEKWHCLH